MNIKIHLHILYTHIDMLVLTAFQSSDNLNYLLYSCALSDEWFVNPEGLSAELTNFVSDFKVYLVPCFLTAFQLSSIAEGGYQSTPNSNVMLATMTVFDLPLVHKVE